MSFYFVILCVHLTVTALMIWLLIRWASRHRRVGQRIHYWGYLSPIVLGTLCVLHIVFFTAPYLLDLIRLINQTYEVGTYEVVSVQGPWVTLQNGTVMVTNPFESTIIPGQQYQLTFLPRSLFIRGSILLR